MGQKQKDRTRSGRKQRDGNAKKTLVFQKSRPVEPGLGPDTTTAKENRQAIEEKNAEKLTSFTGYLRRVLLRRIELRMELKEESDE